MATRKIICLAPDEGGRLTGERIDAGIRAEASRARLNVLYAASAAEAAALCRKAGASAALVLTGSHSLAQTIALTLRSHGIHAVFCNMSPALPDVLTSHVLPDFTGMAYRLTSALLANGADRPVFVGFNPDSCHDARRLAGAEAACRSVGVSLARIDYGGELSAAAEELLERQAEFGHILCANDFIARYLVDRLPPERLSAMASLGGTQRFSGVLTAAIDYEAVGAEAVRTCLHLMRRGSTCACGIGVTLPVAVGEAADEAQPHDPAQTEQDNFWHDVNVSAIDRAARVMSAASPEDAAVIALLLEDRTYERIAELTFMSVRTVKNHVKKLYELAGCPDRKEFCALMRALEHSQSTNMEE